MTPLIKTISPNDFIELVKTKYIAEFGRLDDNAYFIAGFLLSVFNDMGKADLVQFKDIVKKECLMHSTDITGKCMKCGTQVFFISD